MPEAGWRVGVQGAKEWVWGCLWGLSTVSLGSLEGLGSQQEQGQSWTQSGMEQPLVNGAGFDLKLTAGTLAAQSSLFLALGAPPRAGHVSSPPHPTPICHFLFVLSAALGCGSCLGGEGDGGS